MHKISVVYPKGRHAQLRYRDEDGRMRKISAGSSKKSEVLKKVKELEAKLLLDQPVLTQRDKKKKALTTKGSATPWQTFADIYKEKKLSLKAESTQLAEEPTIDVFTRLFGRRTIGQVASKENISDTIDRLLAGEGSQKKKRRTVSTVNNNLRLLKSMLNWAYVDMGWLKSKPVIKEIKADDDEGEAKGRPVTEDEVELMVQAAYVRCPVDPKSYETLIRGVFASGLRLKEAMLLTFNDRTSIHLKKLTSGYVIVFPASKHKKRKRVEIPTIPEFAKLVDSLPYSDGFIFRPVKQNEREGRPSAETVGRWCRYIGEEANIVVNDSGSYAGAHSLRRGFAQRLADNGCNSKDLQFIMRHSSITTTLKYYTSKNAGEANERLRKLGL